MLGYKKSTQYDFSIEWVKKMSRWKTHFLSQVGRSILIKSIVQVMPIHLISYILIPTEVCDKLQSLASIFFWSPTIKTREMAWDHLCSTKKAMGLSFKDIHAFNLTFLTKQAWRLAKDDSSLVAKVLRGKYFHASFFLHVSILKSYFIIFKVFGGKGHSKSGSLLAG